MAMIEFEDIRERAENRKGGAEALARLLPPPPDHTALASVSDTHVLSEMARLVFSSGFSRSVIEAMWPGFVTAFLGFEPEDLAERPDAFWYGLASDTRIVRNGQKIRSVRTNARFVLDIAREHGSFGRFLAGWPSTDQISLLDILKRRGDRLGSRTGQLLLRVLGWDGFVLSADVTACLRAAGLDIASEVSSKGDFARVQAQFNEWAGETGLPYTHLSRICALSIGANRIGFDDPTPI